VDAAAITATAVCHYLAGNSLRHWSSLKGIRLPVPLPKDHEKSDRDHEPGLREACR